ncbi:MAG TPA: hypothetical protein VF783_14165 [Terriglobales bacterium]
MIFNAYKVAVELSIVDKVSPFLSAFSTRLEAAGVKVDALEKKLKQIGKMAAAGGVLAGMGVGMLAAAEKLGQAAAEYETIWARLRQMGLGQAQIADARKWAEANDIIGTSLKDRARLFVEAQGAFRESGMAGSQALDAAKTMMPVLANYITARRVLGKDTSEQDELNLNKIVEQMGGLNSSARAKEIANAVFKAAMSSGGMVDARQLRLFKTYAMTASAGLSDRMLFGGLEPIIGEMGGSTAGTGFQTAFNRLNGIMSLAPHLLVQEATKLGLWDAGKVELTRGGAARFNNGDPLNAQLKDLMSHDLPGFAAAMLAKYKTAGITDAADVARENEILFGRTGARFFNLLMKQLPVIQRSLDAFDKSRGINETVADNANSAQMQLLKFSKALETLKTEIGRGVLPVLTPLIEKAAAITHELGKHPALLHALTIAFMSLGAAMTFSGTVLLLTSGFRALGVAAGLVLPLLGSVAAGGAATGIAGALSGLAAIPILPIVAGLAALAAVIWGLSKIPTPKDPNEGELIPGGHGSRRALPAGALQFPAGSMDVPGRLVPGGHGSRVGGTTVALSSYSNEGHGRGPVMPSNQQTIQVNSQINVDGRKLADAVTTHQVQGMNRAQSTSSGYDPTRSAPPIGHTYAR